MRKLFFLLIVAACMLVVLGATQIRKGGHTLSKQKKPSSTKKYIVEDGVYVKQRKIRANSQHQFYGRHRMRRQLPGVRNGGGGYLYNRPVYTSSDHLAARPALPLAEVESHPLSNFPVHYTGDLEDESKDETSKTKTPGDGEKSSAPANHTIKDGVMSGGDKMKDQPEQAKKPAEADQPPESKHDVTQEKAEPPAVAVPASAVVHVGKNMQAEQDLDKPSPSDR
ncbi:hypothetical protein BIW11_13928 [Tropilaelaps mercedesae]|uniref:Uncharacterized protein n=1 Tax=Tropilaelaps mercedesae TaxID=418985 RepID=A0A1V9X020_9ACAR|nr:hypothetical protein BIW11_13928 [Tropilaelaps mercedesae]